MEWAELNPDLLRLIAKKLGDISNFVRFRVVCKNWRLAVGPRDCPPQLPWFLKFQPRLKDSSDHNFFSLYSNRIHTLHIPQAKGKDILGTPSRYILMCGHRNLSFFNPLTGSRFDFPIPQSETFTFGFPMYIGPDLKPNSNPNENGDIAVLYSNEEDYEEDDEFYSVGLWQFAARHLTKIVEVEVPSKSIAYFQGRLFVFDGETTETRVFDATTGDEVLVISPSGIRFISMIEACGDLLGVVMKYLGVGWEFEVYYLEDGGTNSHWVKMTSGIGDRMLFFEWPFSSVGLCLKASDFEGFRGNCIYFTTFSRGEVEAGYNLCRYDLESKETQVIPNTCGFSCWFVPSLY